MEQPENIQRALSTWRKDQSTLFRSLLETKVLSWNSPVNEKGIYRWQRNLAEYLLAIDSYELEEGPTRLTRVFDKTNFVEALIATGWNPNRPLSNGTVPTLYAIESGQGKLAELLFRHNNYIDVQENQENYISAIVQTFYEQKITGINREEAKPLLRLLANLVKKSPEISHNTAQKIWERILRGRMRTLAEIFVNDDPKFDPNLNIKKVPKLNSPTIFFGAVEHGLVRNKQMLELWVVAGGEVDVTDYHRRNLIQAACAGLTCQSERMVSLGLGISRQREGLLNEFCDLVIWLFQHYGLTVNSGSSKDQQFGVKWAEIKDNYRSIIERNESLQTKTSQIDSFANKEYLDKVIPEAKPEPRIAIKDKNTMVATQVETTTREQHRL